MIKDQIQKIQTSKNFQEKVRKILHLDILREYRDLKI